jgi:hypothetical protein
MDMWRPLNGYIGPASLGQPVNAFSLQMTAYTDVNSPNASAVTDLTMNFTMDTSSTASPYRAVTRAPREYTDVMSSFPSSWTGRH